MIGGVGRLSKAGCLRDALLLFSCSLLLRDLTIYWLGVAKLLLVLLILFVHLRYEAFSQLRRDMSLHGRFTDAILFHLFFR
jgi:hypothetical protein